jgi:hypothetical protein
MSIEMGKDRKEKENKEDNKNTKWKLDSIEVIPHKVPEEQYKLLLAELTKLLYLRISQLQNSKETCSKANKQKAG